MNKIILGWCINSKYDLRTGWSPFKVSSEWCHLSFVNVLFLQLHKWIVWIDWPTLRHWQQLKTLKSSINFQYQSIVLDYYFTCWGASFSDTSHSMSVSLGNLSWLKWPIRPRAIFSAETVDSFRGGKGVEGVEAVNPDAAGEGGEGVNKARRLAGSLPTRRWMTAIGALGIGVVEADRISLLKAKHCREVKREWTRFKRANFRDLRLSFSMAEQKEVNDMPSKRGWNK